MHSTHSVLERGDQGLPEETSSCDPGRIVSAIAASTLWVTALHTGDVVTRLVNTLHYSTEYNTFMAMMTVGAAVLGATFGAGLYNGCNGEKGQRILKAIGMSAIVPAIALVFWLPTAASL